MNTSGTCHTEQTSNGRFPGVDRRGNRPKAKLEWSVLDEVVDLHFSGSHTNRDVMRWLGVSEKQYYSYKSRGEVPEEWVEWALMNA